MSYLVRSNNSKKGKKFKKALFFVLIFFVFSYSVSAIAPSFFGNVFNFIAAPFWKTGGFFSGKFEYSYDFIQARRNLVLENRNLREEMKEKKLLLLQFEIFKKENEELKSFLGRESEGNFVLSSILSKPPQSLFNTMIIDVGSNLNIGVGDKVLALGSVALGEVGEVFGKTSRVELFSTPGKETLGIIVRNNLSVTVIGRGGGNFEIHVPHEIEVLPEDIIVLPGVEGFILAMIESVEHSPSDSFQTALANSPVNMSELRWAFVQK